MKALVLKGKARLELTEMPKPVCDEGQALVKVIAVGVCGSDINSYKGLNALLEYPRVMGHETCGVIEELSDRTGDSGFQVGDKVILMPYLNCGHCIACRKGKPNCCTDLTVYGVHIDGAMAEYVAVPLTHLLKVSKDADPAVASVIEPLAISTHAVRRSGAKSGDTVLVAGAGPIGLGAAEIAGTLGARVMLADVDEKRRVFAQEGFGYHPVLDPMDAGYADELKRRTGGEGPDIIIDSTGNSFSMARNISYLSNGGRLVYVGISKGDIQFKHIEFHKRETELLGSRGALKSDFEYVIECMKAGKIHPEKFITHRAAFSESKQALDTWVKLGGEVFKAVIMMECANQ